MTGTERLRELLDERGVPFKTYGVKLYDVTMEVGTVYSGNGIDWVAIENPDTHRISVANFKDELTPEQAVEATLGDSDATAARQDGAGTCHNASDAADEGYFKCSACGASCSVEWESGGWGAPRHCPRCGAKVVG